jgi:hypothetical protein
MKKTHNQDWADCQSDSMTQSTKKLLDDFDALPDADRAKFVAELLRRTAFAAHDLPGDADLSAAADRLFVDLDRREQT